MVEIGVEHEVVLALVADRKEFLDLFDPLALLAEMAPAAGPAAEPAGEKRTRWWFPSPGRDGNSSPTSNTINMLIAKLPRPD